jgi:Ca-activated chloride channel family protein
MNENLKKARMRTLKRLVLAVLGLGLFVVILVVVALRQPPPTKAAPIQARLELAAGEVSVDLGQGPTRAVSGTPLLAGAKITTDKGARALVRLPDGSRLFVRGESSISLGDESITLEKGEYFLDAPPTDRKPLTHQVAGAAISAAESGVSIERQGNNVSVYVARGMATVSGKGGRAEVKAGEQAKVEGDAAPVVSSLAFWDDWTGGMADFASGNGVPGAGAGSIYGVDVGATPGSPARRLEISRQSVRAEVREGISETEVDQTFFNPGERDVEGWYWFTVPENASVTSFALETNGALVEGEFIESKEAAAQYTTAKSYGHAPAILEWVDSRTYRARIYPIQAGGKRRVVLRYVQLNPSNDGKLTYVYPMGQGDPVRIGEFSLRVGLGDAGGKMQIATLADARVEQNGRLVTMRRSGYTPRADFQLEATLPSKRPSLAVSRFKGDGESADYVMVRYTPDVDWKKVKQQRGDVVVVVDTSAAGDEASRQLKAATAESILRALSDEDRFALVALDVQPTVLHPKEGLAPASDAEIKKALEALAGHPSGGATDIASMFDVSLKRLHGAEQPAVVYVGDGIATSGEMTGEQIVERLRRALGTSRARLFSVGVGTDANYPLLAELSRAGGGSSFRVDEAEQTTARALELTAQLKVPTITDLEIDLGAGLDEPFSSASGKVSRGQEVIVLARTHHELPKRVKVRGRVGGEQFETEYDAERETSIISEFVPRLWAAEYVRRLLGGAQGPDAERGRIVALGLEYGLMTPFSSILALESENAYYQMGIQRKRSKLRGRHLTELDPDTEMRIGYRHAAITPPTLLPLGCSKLERGLAGDDEPPPTAAQPLRQQKAEAPSYGPRAQEEPAAGGGVMPSPAPTAVAEAKEADDEAPSTLAPPAEPEPAAPPAMKPAPAKMARAYAPRAKSNGPAPLTGFGAGGKGRVGITGEIEKKDKDRNEVDLDAPPTGPGGRRVDEAIAKEQLRTCSDGAARPLAQRVLLWAKRLRTASSPMDLVGRYDAALAACELNDWRAERTFLDLLQRKVDSEGAAAIVLGHFSARPDVQKFVAKLILRRAVDERLVLAVERALFGSAVDWAKVDLELTEIEDADKRIAKLREYIAKAPDDPNGGVRLIKLLVEANKRDEAVALGRRLRDQGFLTPNIARQIGDVLSRAKLADEAVRTYSEIVEFDPEGIDSRRLLGDIYLGHGWYEPAYRQYRTITEEAKDDSLGWLRLAAAAAGAGRIDEALRLERKIASAQGTPGPNDPRRWARLLSAARLARLIDKPPKGTQPDSIKRKLKELQLFSGPGTLVLLTWEDLSADVMVATRVDDKDSGLGEATDASKVGLYSVLATAADLERASFVVHLRSPKKDDPVALIRQDVTWNGKDFSVAVKSVELPAKATEVGL